MEQSLLPGKQKGKLSIPYLLMNIGFLLVLPVAAAATEHYVDHLALGIHLLIKWFVFSAVGMRLFTAGVKQAATPEYTANNIFKLKGKEVYVVIRELGFANMALGIMGILSVLNDSWRIFASIAAGIFFGFAAMQHCSKEPCCPNETVALVYDAIVFLVLIFFLVTQR